jgi:hypothetical protein
MVQEKETKNDVSASYRKEFVAVTLYIGFLSVFVICGKNSWQKYASKHAESTDSYCGVFS